MSFQPPPQPHQPPGQPQPPQQPIGFGAPTSGGQRPATGSSGRAHKPRMVAPAMIVAALVLIAVAVGVVVLAGGGGGGEIDAEGAADGIDAVVDDAEFDGASYADLRRCPFGDEVELAERIADTLDLSDDVLDGPSAAYASDPDGGPKQVGCSLRDGDPSEDPDVQGVFLDANTVPRGDYDEFIEDTFTDADVDFEDPVDYKGGVIHAYCVQPSDASPGCGADWVDEENDIVVAVNFTTDDDDPAPAVDALKELLPDLVKALAEES